MDNFLTDYDFNLIKALIYNHSGIHFSTINRSILESRLKERLKVIKMTSARKYYNLLLVNRDELNILLDSVTTNLTRFFRNYGHFKAFEKYVVEKIMDYKSAKNCKYIRVWSAGCATGEEPYSIAMVLKDKLPSNIKIQVIGSDISLKSLMTAKQGYYPENRVKDVPGYYLKRYFEKKSDGYTIKEEIRNLIQFDYHNLKFDSGQQAFDIVFCRNVIIYFDSEAQKATINRLWRAMSEYSFLFIGHSESLFGMNTKFKFVKTEWTTLYAKNTEKEGV